MGCLTPARYWGEEKPVATKIVVPSTEEDFELRWQSERRKALRAFWFRCRDEFLARYPDQFVAVKDPLGEYQVIAAAASIATLLDTIASLGVDRRDIDIEFIATASRTPMPLLRPSDSG